MKIKEITDKYKNCYRFGKETGMAPNSYLNWINMGYIPIISQLKLEQITNGEFKADLNHTVKDDIR